MAHHINMHSPQPRGQKLLTWTVVLLVFAFFVTGGVPVQAPLPPDALASEVGAPQPNRRPLSVQGASSAIVNAVLEGPSFHAPEHFQGSAPFLFLTAADVARAREGVRTNPEFARLARELARQAEREQLENLPVLDNSWWHALTNKPWRDCYPENHHYTLAVPQRWASLARDCARASLVNEAPELADKGRQVLLQLSDYSFAWEHFDTGMFYTIWAAQALEAYDILRTGFSAPERARLDAFFERYLAAVVKSDDYWVQHEPGGELNNHYAWHKLGRCMIGLFYRRPELVEQALHGPKGVAHMMATGFKDNGLWLEGAIPYQLAETVPLVLMADLMENAGYKENLWRNASLGGPSLKQTYDALITLLLPDGTLPSIGDAYARRSHLGACPDFELLARRFGDPAYAWLIHDRQTRVPQALFSGLPQLAPGAPPPQQTQVWTNMGYAALRSVEGTAYWSGEGWTAFATFSGQPVHQHADKLSVLLFGGGHLWLPDREARTAAEHAFSSAVQNRLNRETLCHNTLLVDHRSQAHPGQRLELVEFVSEPDAKRLTMADPRGRLYPGVRQMRTLIVRRDYVLDFFQVRSEALHDYAWVVHMDGEPAHNSLTNWTGTTFPTNAPWSYLLSPRRAPTPSAYEEKFTHAGQAMRLDLRCDGPAEVVQCGFPADDSPNPKPLPMRLVQCRRTGAWFLAVYCLGSERAEPVAVETGKPRTWEIMLNVSGKTARHSVPSL